MAKQRILKSENEVAAYYDAKGVLDELTDEPVSLELDLDLRTAILSGRRHRKTQTITLRMDPFQMQALHKIATLKSIPYQDLIRHWVAMHIKEEMSNTPR